MLDKKCNKVGTYHGFFVIYLQGIEPTPVTIFISLMPCWPTGNVALLYVSFFITSEMVSPYYKTRLKMSSCELSFQSIAVQMRRHQKKIHDSLWPGMLLALKLLREQRHPWQLDILLRCGAS